MNRNVHLIIYLPTPSVIIHRTHCQILAIKKVNFRVQHPLCSFIHWNLISYESLEKHVVENAFKNRLIPFSCSQYCRWYSFFDCVDKLSVELKHGVMIRLNNFDIFFCFSNIVDNIILNFPSFCCKIIMK
mgnify:CR=1 FL=1